MRFYNYIEETRSTMTKHFDVPKGVKAKTITSDNGEVWMNQQHKIGNISQYSIESWFQNNNKIIAKLRKK
jgi:hypothetical protein